MNIIKQQEVVQGVKNRAHADNFKLYTFATWYTDRDEHLQVTKTKNSNSAGYKL